MAFEIVKKKEKGSLVPHDTVSIRQSFISFGSDIAEFMGDHTYMEVFFDRDNQKVGFKSTDSSLTGFKVKQPHPNDKHHKISPQEVLDRLPEGRYKMELEGDFLIIKVPNILDKKDKSKVSGPGTHIRY